MNLLQVVPRKLIVFIIFISTIFNILTEIENATIFKKPTEKTKGQQHRSLQRVTTLKTRILSFISSSYINQKPPLLKHTSASFVKKLHTSTLSPPRDDLHNSSSNFVSTLQLGIFDFVNKPAGRVDEGDGGVVEAKDVDAERPDIVIFDMNTKDKSSLLLKEKMKRFLRPRHPKLTTSSLILKTTETPASADPVDHSKTNYRVIIHVIFVIQIVLILVIIFCSRFACFY